MANAYDYVCKKMHAKSYVTPRLLFLLTGILSSQLRRQIGIWQSWNWTRTWRLRTSSTDQRSCSRWRRPSPSSRHPALAPCRILFLSRIPKTEIYRSQNHISSSILTKEACESFCNFLFLQVITYFGNYLKFFSSRKIIYIFVMILVFV